MKVRRYPLLPLLLSLLLAACASTPPAPAPAWPEPDTFCASDRILVDSHFDAGNMGRCEVSSEGDFTLTLFPEDDPPINRSTWYAFRVSGQAGETVNFRLLFEHGYARYWPKISLDGKSWARLDEDQVAIDEADQEWMEIRLPLTQSRVWIAGQEIIDDGFYEQWMQRLEQRDDVTSRLLGRSVEGRPLILLETPDKPEFILMMGRQHPPEITGALAMRAFMDTVFSESELARQFRGRYKLAIVPLMNPDGVAGGHWRHNVNGADVNRDWGPFEQPESQSVIRWVEQKEAEGLSLELMLDFHSTWEDLFYTQPIEDNPPDFASLWLGAAAQRLPDFPFRHAASPVSKQANAKNYFYKTRGIPAVTYEAGDETDREALGAAAVVFAEEMMRTMLAR